MSEERIVDGPVVGYISRPWRLIDLINASPEAQQQLKDAGWLPPCEGRKIFDGETAWDLEKFLVMNTDDRPYRLILDPIRLREGD